MQIGDFVKGVSDKYGITNTKMTKGLVTEVSGESIKVKVIEHENNEIGAYYVSAKYFEVIGHQKEFDRDAVLELLKNGCKKAILDYDLSGADLRDADLRRADLSGADLSDADLSGADLRDANLRDADLRRADLSGADLSGADLRDANLRRADLSGADLRDADLRRADLRDADLRRADLSGADLDFSCYPLWCGGLHIKTDKRIACQFAYHLCTMQCDDEEFIKMRNSILGFANQFHRVDECGVLEPIEERKDDSNAYKTEKIRTEAAINDTDT